MTRVLLLDPAGRLDTVRAALAHHPEITVERAARLPSTSAPDVVALLVPPEIPVGAAQLRHLPSIRLVAATATGFDHLDADAIAAAGAWATYCPGYCDEEVAEHALALTLALLRGVAFLDDAARAGTWSEGPAPPRRVAGATLGIVGLGRIGRQVARRATALGMTVVAHDPLAAVTDADPDGVPLVALDQLLRRSDVITLHALLTDETRGMIGADELAAMRRGGYLVNCARAALVDHDALGEALRSGHLAGCALDVLPVEPPPGDEPVFGWPRTIITPHSAWYSPQSATAPYRMAAEAAAAVLDGREPFAALSGPRTRRD